MKTGTDMNQETSIIQYENVNKILLKLSEDISIYATWEKNEVSYVINFGWITI